MTLIGKGNYSLLLTKNRRSNVPELVEGWSACFAISGKTELISIANAILIKQSEHHTRAEVLTGGVLECRAVEQHEQRA